MNKQAHQYYKDIYRMFPEHTHEEKNFLHQLEDFIQRYDTLHPDAQYDHYIEKFGEPQEIVSSYYKRVDNTLVIEKMKAKKIIKRASIILLVSFIIFMLWISYTRYQEYQYTKESTYYWEEYITDSD